jgi:hypothetical protein
MRRLLSFAWIPLPFVTQPRDLNDVRVPTTAAEPGSAYQYSEDAPLADKALLEVEKFKSARSSNLAFWRAWWNQHRDAIAGASAR